MSKKYSRSEVFVKLSPVKKGIITGFFVNKFTNQIVKIHDMIIQKTHPDMLTEKGFKIIGGDQADAIVDMHLDEIEGEKEKITAIFTPDQVARWPKEFHDMVTHFETTREFDLHNDSLGVMSQRGEHYKVPVLDPANVARIEANRNYIRGLNIQPDDSFKIPWAVEGKTEETEDYFYKWKPHLVELFGIDRAGLDNIANDVIRTKRLARIVSIHGAEHSVAMLIMLLELHIPFDFCYYTELPTEQMDEYDYVKYYVQALANIFKVKIPLVVVVPQDDAETYYERSAMYPREDKRWCTLKMKLNPYKKLLKEIFYEKLEPGDYVDILQFLGMQAFQSEGRASLNPYATPSFLSLPPPYEETPEEKERKKREKEEKAKAKQNQALGERVMRGGKEWLANWPSTDMNQWQRLMQNGTITNRSVMRVFDMLPVFKLSHEDDLAMLARHDIKRNPNSEFFGRHGCMLCPFASWQYYHQLKLSYPKIYARACQIRDMASETGIHKQPGESGYLAKRWTQFKKVSRAMERAGYVKGGPTPF
jgi:3'-phosphoadenosine 5'-phosphosulfate sulfotransferase (PAPS reductase)/FAD synthetase